MPYYCMLLRTLPNTLLIIFIMTGESKLNDVKEEIYTLAAKYFELGVALGIPVHELEKLQNQYGAVNFDRCFIEVILLWLRGCTSRTWQALVRAVDSKSGVNDHSLALEIAGRHKAVGAHMP